VAERLVTDEQLDDLVEQRMAAALAERRKVAEEVVSMLQPELEGIRQEAHNANGIKRTLGRQLTRLERAVINLATDVKQARAELKGHAELPFHTEGAETITRLTQQSQMGLELLEEFGVEDLSLDQKRALPEVLDEHVRNKQARAVGDRRASDRLNATHALSALVSAILTAIAMGGGLYVYLSTHPIGGR
jgi:hypothetical protein